MFVHCVPLAPTQVVEPTPVAHHATGPGVSAAFWLGFTVLKTDRPTMGCCEGKLPSPDDFLAAQHPRPVGPFLSCVGMNERTGMEPMIAVMHSGNCVLTLELCPHRSFRSCHRSPAESSAKKFSYIRSPENELLGAMQTLEKYRPLQSTRSISARRRGRWGWAVPRWLGNEVQVLWLRDICSA
eukprot:Skav217930  [mRNA]  locus=scaffold2633:222154:224093:- [translate_table: standard]